MSRKASRNGLAIPAVELLRCVPAWECHIHTSFSDGTAGVHDCVTQAYECGLSRIIFTEHTEPWKVKKPEWFTEYTTEVREAARQYAGVMDVFLGLETPATDFEEGLELTEEMRKEADYILGAAHRYPGMEGRRVRDLSHNECVQLEFTTLMSLAHNPGVDAIAHIGATCEQYCCAFPEELTTEVVRTAVSHGVAIELNSRYHKSLTRMYSICVRENALVTIGSDAHALSEIGEAYATLKASLEEKPHA